MKKSIRQIIIISLGIVTALILFRASSSDLQSERIVGTWYADELNKSLINITKTNNGSYKGIIISSEKEEYVGKTVIYDCIFQPKSNDYTGTIYSVARGMKLDGTFELISSNRLKVTGRKWLMTKTFYWERE